MLIQYLILLLFVAECTQCIYVSQQQRRRHKNVSQLCAHVFVKMALFKIKSFPNECQFIKRRHEAKKRNAFSFALSSPFSSSQMRLPFARLKRFLSNLTHACLNELRCVTQGTFLILHAVPIVSSRHMPIFHQQWFADTGSNNLRNCPQSTPSHVPSVTLITRFKSALCFAD